MAVLVEYKRLHIKYLSPVLKLWKKEVGD